VILPRGYNRRLQRRDRLLRMRWSPRRECWLLERKATFGRMDRDPATLPYDTYVQLRDGYHELWTYPPRALPPVDALVRQLDRADTWRPGVTADRMADRLDQRDDAEEARLDAWGRSMTEDIASDVYDDVVWARGERAVVPGEFGAGGGG